MTKEKLVRLQEKIGENTIHFETGRIARQSNGAVMVRLGDTIVLSACTAAKSPRETPPNFVPLTVDYKERTYAAGKIPGGFFKREGRPREKEILGSRLSDRSLRPLFPEHYNTETQIISMVLSSDSQNDADVLAINAASAALTISSIPFNGPVAAVRIGKINGSFVINPTFEERLDSEIDLVVSGTLHGIVMVEGGGKEIPDQELTAAMEKCMPEIEKLCRLQEGLRKQTGVPKKSAEIMEIKPEIKSAVEKTIQPRIRELLNSFTPRQAFENSMDEMTDASVKEFSEKFPVDETIPYQVKAEIQDTLSELFREMVLEKKTRPDGRKYDEIREILIQTGLLPRTHGSALFTRGETQTIATATLGTPEDKQILDDLEGRSKERFMLHYNFPGFSTGEVRPDRGPGRREIGHGALARRALYPLLPTEDRFPYTIRIVSDILESNGSSSMATVCGGSLSLFDAGVPMTSACAGIAMGLIMEGEKFAVLSDIAGLEDHFGDMDFKLAGTRKGITAFQMDVKLESGIPIPVLKAAVEQAGRARNHILDLMEKNISAPKTEVSDYAPKIVRLTIPKEKIGAFIGPGGKNIRGIIEKTGADIEVEDDGSVFISSPDKQNLEAAKAMVEYYTLEVEVGKIYTGKVVSIVDFGAFVEILPGKEGLLHISEIDHKRIRKVEDVLKMGEQIKVKVMEMDNIGKFRLSRKAVLSSER
ncbi:MAG: polyribonucleotide nucleotidyltransferase [Elusimicrobia bacterium]|nr:polyribonucleotide nucleotidyltransferase [Elusimicrobiota bacterium]